MSGISPPAVIACIEKGLQMKAGAIGEDSRAEDIAAWDSLGQLSVLVALDELFEGKIANITEMAEADSVPRILEVLRQHALL